MFEFKITKRFGPKKENNNEDYSDNYFWLIYKSHPLFLIPLIVAIHYGIFPAWVAIIPKSISIFIGGFITLALMLAFFIFKLFRHPKFANNNPLFTCSEILDILNCIALSTLLFFMGWFSTFLIYSIPISVLIFLYFFYRIYPLIYRL